MKRILSILSILFCLNSFGQAQFDAVYVANNSIDSILSGGVKIWEKPASLCPSGQVEIMGECYDTVRIGSQVWMSANLHYDDLGGGIYSYNDEPDSSAIYGYLYTWDAAVRVAESINGWHLASDEEWKTLEMYMGMSQIDADGTSYRGTDEGSKLAGIDTLWNDGLLESDASFGLSGLNLIGNGQYIYGYDNIRVNGFTWTSTEIDATLSYCRNVHYNYTTVYRNGLQKIRGMSVRLIKD